MPTIGTGFANFPDGNDIIDLSTLEGKVSELEKNKLEAKDLADYAKTEEIANTYLTKAEAVGGIHLKGSVDTVTDLDAKKATAKNGDLWNVKDTDMNYVYIANEQRFDAMGNFFNPEGLVEDAELEKTLKDYVKGDDLDTTLDDYVTDEELSEATKDMATTKNVTDAVAGVTSEVTALKAKTLVVSETTYTIPVDSWTGTDGNFTGKMNVTGLKPTDIWFASYTASQFDAYQTAVVKSAGTQGEGYIDVIAKTKPTIALTGNITILREGITA